MTKFTLEVLEYWSQTYEVDADNLAEAIDAVHDGGGVEVGKPVFMLRDEAEFWRRSREDGSDILGDIPEPWEDIVE